MVEIGIHSCLILDVRKMTNGSDNDLDQTELAHFVGQVSNEGNGVVGQIEMDLRGKMELATAVSLLLNLGAARQRRSMLF
jgi:hypothetical protein